MGKATDLLNFIESWDGEDPWKDLRQPSWWIDYGEFISHKLPNKHLGWVIGNNKKLLDKWDRITGSIDVGSKETGWNKEGFKKALEAFDKELDASRELRHLVANGYKDLFTKHLTRPEDKKDKVLCVNLASKLNSQKTKLIDILSQSFTVDADDMRNAFKKALNITILSGAGTAAAKIVTDILTKIFY